MEFIQKLVSFPGNLEMKMKIWDIEILLNCIIFSNPFNFKIIEYGIRNSMLVIYVIKIPEYGINI